MKRRRILLSVILIAAALLTLLSLATLVFFGPGIWPFKCLLAWELVGRIAVFEERHGRLPGDMAELEPRLKNDAGPIYYQPDEAGRFSVWFNLSDDEIFIYSSERKTWSRAYVESIDGC